MKTKEKTKVAEKTEQIENNSIETDLLNLASNELLSGEQMAQFKPYITMLLNKVKKGRLYLLYIQENIETKTDDYMLVDADFESSDIDIDDEKMTVTKINDIVNIVKNLAK